MSNNKTELATLLEQANEKLADKISLQIEASHRATETLHPASYYAGVDVGVEQGAQLPTELLMIAVKSLQFYSNKEFDRVCFLDHSTCHEEYGADARDVLNQIRARLESELGK